MIHYDPFDAIENRMQAVYPHSILQLFGGVQGRSDHALNGAVVMRVETPEPHWLIVSQGFTELWDKVSPDSEVSGLGFELVCRIPAHSHEAGQEIGWVLHWMQGVADTLAFENASLADGHWMPMVEARSPDEVCALAFVDDPVLARIESRNGRSGFLQIVGLCPGGLDAVQRGSVHGYVSLLRERDALCRIDPSAPSPLRDGAFAEAVEAGIAASGPRFRWRNARPG